MKPRIRPMAEINQQAEAILIREMGIAAALRFLSQFRTGSGDYTKDRAKWLDELSLEEIVSEVKNRRRKQRRQNR